MTVYLAPYAVQQFTDSNGNLLSGGLLFTYQAGTTTKLATYTDSTGVTPNTNPIVINARGEANIWLTSAAYKFVLSPPGDTDPPSNPIWTVDNILGTVVSPVSSLATIAALRALTSNSVIGPSINVTGYYSLADGGEGLFSYNTADTSSADNSGTIIVDAAGRRYYRQINGKPVTPKQFGAKGDNSTNDTSALNAWLAYILSTGWPGYVGKGRYLYSGSTAFTLQMSAIRTYGLTIDGAGVQQAIIDVSGVTAAPQSIVECSTADNFYLTLTNFGILGSTTGAVFQIGQSSFSDPVNEPVMNLWVYNKNTTGTARAVEVNYVLNGRLRFVANVAGTGIGMMINQAEICTFEGSYSAIGGTGIRLTGGYSFGNTFLSPDIENVATCLVVDGANAINNVFVSGQWSYTASGIDASLGHGNIVISPNLAPVSPGTASGFLGNGVGISVIAPGEVSFSTPAVPSSGVSYTNKTGKMVSVNIGSNPVSSVSVNGTTFPATTISVGGTNYQTATGTYILNPNDAITLVYGGAAPAWIWLPIL